MEKTIVTAENFDSRNLFIGINRQSIANMFSDPDSDSVKSLNSRLRTVLLSSAVLDEIMASIEFADDDVARNWCRFVGADDADHATAVSARWWLRKHVMNGYGLETIEHACDDVAASKTFLKAGRINKMICRMLRERITNATYVTDPLIDNYGSPFTRDKRETQLLYEKMMRNPRWAGRTFGNKWFPNVGRYQWVQFQRLFGLSDLSSTMDRLQSDLQSALDSVTRDELEQYDLLHLDEVEFVPVFSQNEVLPPAEVVQNALLYWHVMKICVGDRANFNADCTDLQTFAYLYGGTDFSYNAITQKLNMSAELQQIADDRSRPSRAFGLLDLDAINRIATGLDVDVTSADTFLHAHAYSSNTPLIIPSDAEEAILHAMLQDANGAWAREGSILLDAYNKNLVARAKAEMLIPSEAALYEHWRPSVNVMKAVVAKDTGNMSVFDLSGEALEKAFAKSLAHTYAAHAQDPALSAWIGDTPGHRWLDGDYMHDAYDELNALHGRNEKRRSAIVFPTNE